MNNTTQKTNTSAILFFIKYPTPGKVKSRLITHLNPDLVTQLYQCFVIDILNMLNKTHIPLIICYEPIEHYHQIHQWLGKKYQYTPQKGKDLGERLENAFREGFNQGYTHLLVIGSDSPDLPQKTIHEAFHRLNLVDVVIGPSTDGGYYLLGLKKESYSSSLFTDIHWSTDTVFSDTVKKIKQAHQTIFILPEWYDIDNYSDLHQFYHRNLTNPLRKSKTMVKLRHYFKQKDTHPQQKKSAL